MTVPFIVRVGLFGFRATFGPLGLTDNVVDMPPWNPLRPVNVIWELPVDPGETFNAAGFAVTLKSGTRTVTLTECTIKPLVPVTVTM